MLNRTIVSHPERKTPGERFDDTHGQLLQSRYLDTVVEVVLIFLSQQTNDKSHVRLPEFNNFPNFEGKFLLSRLTRFHLLSYCAVVQAVNMEGIVCDIESWFNCKSNAEVEVLLVEGILIFNHRFVYLGYNTQLQNLHLLG